MPTSRRFALRLVLLALLASSSFASLECNPSDAAKKPDPKDNTAYFYCSLEGVFARRSCVQGRQFNATTLDCQSDESLIDSDDPFSNPLNQAPADLCGSGIPLTRLSAPVLCNPSISSCPDGYVCTLYAVTGSSYCCQNPTSVTTSGYCTGNQVTYISPTTGQPLSCVLGQPSTCPTGFGCNIVSGTVTRCCGANFGCPYNSAAFINAGTASYVVCVLGQANVCQNGFVCAQSVSLNTPICCSATSSTVTNLCPSGQSPLASPLPCSASAPCPAAYTCNIVNNQGICCPSSAVCPAGDPLGGITVCSEANPCQTGYQCVTSNGAQYCCKKPDMVCGLLMNSGVACAVTQATQAKYYFDVTTGTCRTFLFSGCGGNENRFDTQQQCESFCLAKQCPVGKAYRVGTSAANSACTTSVITCPSQYTCQAPIFGPTNQICCPTPELVCNEAVASGTACFTSTTSLTRYYFNPTTRQCAEFQYLGCDGGSNNFGSRLECNNYCLSVVSSVCSGAAPLLDPNNNYQICSASVPCPSGYTCTASGAISYCCPLAATACNQAVSVGVACVGGVQRVMWYYSTTSATCNQFTYLGCGGNSNRFTDQTVCTSYCAATGTISGNCPNGMTPVIPSGQTTVQVCTLNVPLTCPSGSSCVRSTTSAAICCQGTLTCPANRVPYIIPGSDSVVSCEPDLGNQCPTNNECVASANVSGFFLCCSLIGTTTTTCPNNLLSNGQVCTMNAVNGCASGYLCLRPVGGTGAVGTCCQAVPACAGGLIPSYIGGSTNQVQVCAADLAGCPLGSACTATTIPLVTICCQTSTATSLTRCFGNVQPYIPPGNTLPQACLVNALNVCPLSYSCQVALDGTYVCCPVQQTLALCSTGVVPYYPPGSSVPQVCNIMVTSCPIGYSCQTSSTAGQYYCCPGTNVLSATCPSGTTNYLLYSRSLSCPRGSTACPIGYFCTQSTVNGVYLCCGSSLPVTTLAVPNCANGAAPYVTSGTAQRQYCSPTSANVCPNGYSCLASTNTGQYICCATSTTVSNPLVLTDYCPAFQIPYVPSGSTVPVLCQITTNPCALPYVCIYSSVRQNAYCCAPTSSSTSSTSAFDGCPIGSRPLIDGSNVVRQCDPLSGTTACPSGFTCQYSIPFLRWQCCTQTTTSRVRKWPVASINPAGFRFSALPSAPLTTTECPLDTYKINSKCLPLYYPGQRGCTVNDQCALKVMETKCDAGYCMCPTHKLIFNGRCVGYCPDGYINAAARCNDITKIVMMDAVDDRQNGTIGGWCLNTVIKEKQCTVEHSECSDRSLTCQCKHGYELEIRISDQSPSTTIGVCKSITDSRWHHFADEVEMSGDTPLYADEHELPEDEPNKNGVFLQVADI